MRLIPRSIRDVMVADTILNLVSMGGVLVFAPRIAAELRLESRLPVVALAGLLGLSAAFHWMTGRSGSRAMVKVMAAMDATVLFGTLFVASMPSLDAPAWLRVALVVGAILAFTMGALKIVALRAPEG